MINNIYDTFQTSIFDIFISISILILSFFFLIFIARRAKKNFAESLLVFFFHFLWGVFYIIISYEYTDSSGWYFNAPYFLENNLIIDKFISNIFISNHYLYVINFIMILSKINYFNANLIFNFFSSMGLVFFYYSLSNYRILGNLKTKNIIIIFFFLTPSFMFWTSGISKDSLIFFFLSFLIFYLNHDSKKNYLFIIFLIFLIYLLRPYVGIIFILSLIFYFIFIYKKKYFLYFSLLFGIIFLYNHNDFINTFNKILNYRHILLSQYVNTNLGLPHDMNYILRILNYFFSPFFFNTNNNIMLLIISFENLFLILFLIYLFINFRISLFFKKKKNIDLIVLFYIIISTILLTQTTSNLGIAFRQKWMILSFLIYFLVKYQKISIKKIGQKFF